MTLTFDSHFDWLLILLSWHYYESFWDFLHGIGFVYLPFIFIFLKNSYEPIIKDGFLKGSAVSLRQVEWACFTAFLVIMCVAQPYIKIETGAMAFF